MKEIVVPPPGTISPLLPGSGAKPAGAPAPSSGASFYEVLERVQSNKSTPAAGRVKFSAHAEERLQSRNIRLSSEDHGRLSEAMDRAEAKGARDSLIMMNNVAYVVSVENRTVITAVENEDAGNVFTNIDSAVFA